MRVNSEVVKLVKGKSHDQYDFTLLANGNRPQVVMTGKYV